MNRHGLPIREFCADEISVPSESDRLLIESSSSAAIRRNALDLGADIALNADSISIWRVGLEWQGPDIEAVAEILSSEEQKRASRFHRACDRRDFIVARGGLRLILAHYLNVDPRQISFEYNTFGKPQLTDGVHYPDVRFSVTHSSGVALYALAIGREIGVDLERVEPDFATMGLAGSMFAPEEVAALSTLSNEDFVASFYRCWTRKEAYMKAKGLGLSLPLSSFVVSVEPPNGAPLLVADRNEIGEQARWMLVDLIVGKGFASSLAVECQT